MSIISVSVNSIYIIIRFNPKQYSLCEIINKGFIIDSSINNNNN